MGYDFKAARERIEKLKAIYRKMKRTHRPDGTWDWFLVREIDGLEMEIAEAHKSKMTAGQDGHPVNSFGKDLTPIIPAWGSGGKEVVQSGSF